MNGAFNRFGEQLQNNAVSVFGFTGFMSLRVKGRMSLRNDMWHGMRNDIIMQNVRYSETCIKRTPLGNAVVSA